MALLISLTAEIIRSPCFGKQAEKSDLTFSREQAIHLFVSDGYTFDQDTTYTVAILTSVPHPNLVNHKEDATSAPLWDLISELGIKVPIQLPDSPLLKRLPADSRGCPLNLRPRAALLPPLSTSY